MKITEMIDDAINVYKQSLGNAAVDMTNAQKAARDILKNAGLLKDSVDLNHSFPKPTVIKRRDGTEIVLGASGSSDEEDK